jgi:hypothetical protein
MRVTSKASNPPQGLFHCNDVMDSSSPSATSANAEAQPGANEQKPKIFTLPSFTKLWDKKKPQPNFPPSTWDVSKNTPGTATTSTLPSTGLHPDVANTGSSYIGTIGKGNATTALSEEEPVKASLVEDAPDDAAASLTLAQRIRDLIPSHDASNKDTTIPVYPPQSTESHSVPPPRPAWIDAGIAQLLESAEFMNGTISQGRKSVWDVLERLRAPKEAEKDTSMDHKSPGTEVDEIESDSDADSSVMLYAPLVPDNDSKVELAERETVKTDAQGNLIEVIRDRPAHPIKEAQPSANDGAKMERRRTWWPFGAQKGKEKAQETAKLARSQSFEENSLRQTEITIEPQGIPANDSHPTETVIQSLKRRVSQKLQEHSVWVPSATKISFQATWWGYRMWVFRIHFC